LPFGDSDGLSGEKALYVNGVKTEVPGGDVAGFIVNDAVKTLSPATPFPISELGSKAIKKTVGAIAFDAAKEQDDVIGLSDAQIEKLIEAEMTTVEGLEKWIAEDANWNRKISGFGAKAIDRISSTIVAFRRVNPIPAVE